MSVNALEKALWRASANRADAQRCRDDAQAYSKEFKLDEDERSMLLSWDVSTLHSRGVNPLLLLMAFVAVNGMQKLGEYETKMNQPRPGASAQ